MGVLSLASLRGNLQKGRGGRKLRLCKMYDLGDFDSLLIFGWIWRFGLMDTAFPHFPGLEFGAKIRYQIVPFF
jgi:hypothetical protein